MLHAGLRKYIWNKVELKSRAWASIFPLGYTIELTAQTANQLHAKAFRATSIKIGPQAFSCIAYDQSQVISSGSLDRYMDVADA